jgi:hypothetical protein
MRTDILWRCIKRDFPDRYAIFLQWFGEHTFDAGVLLTVNDLNPAQRVAVFSTFPVSFQATIYVAYWLEVAGKFDLLNLLPGNLVQMLQQFDTWFTEAEMDLYDRSA